MVRSQHIKQRLKELREARIGRLYDIRASLKVTESIRKAMRESLKEELRAHVQHLRVEVRELLKQYKADRLGRSQQLEESREVHPTAFSPTNRHAQVIEPGTNKQKLPPPVVLGMGYKDLVPAKQQEAEEPSDTATQVTASQENKAEYKSQLSRVVDEIRQGKSVHSGKKSTQDSTGSLMSRIRKLTNVGRSQKSGEAAKNHESVKTSTLDLGAKSLKTEAKKAYARPQEPSAPAEEASNVQYFDLPENELLRVKGIGPSIAKRLNGIGICTLEDLATTSKAHLEQSFGEFARLADVGEWITEAQRQLSVAA